jgi:2-keto-4-pentenoate hydratase/2-oxohepta-3-ene-1,7-dioic acid hydratase in catechol pathway
MKLAAYLYRGVRAWGAVVDNDVIDLTHATGAHDLVGVLASNILKDCSFLDAPHIALNDVNLLPPVDPCRKILCVGLNYSDHIEEMGREFPVKPAVFTRFADSLVGNSSPLIRPCASEKFDYEGEFCVVIGRSGRLIPVENAQEFVLGYTLMNDGSVRDYQRHTTQFTPGKNFPRSGSLGPYIVTADEFGPLRNQRIRTYVGDELMQDSDIGQLVFDVGRLIAYISEWTELSPGDIIATGTPGGVGDGRAVPRDMTPGDSIRVAVDGLAVLTNPVVDDDRVPVKGEK